ncbi:PAS domain S-box-containing protein/diguanylate cyclase (GGDEF) domain-containing protein [Allopseudospirillum japonicum]|uniref:PAS domain S-box-containing protein/diguanylate cyclase (GGDEF) domain-containing protein n=1 Tax=Allopseudospirillum japonicum TaxID=64971 RepID=A0A1H6QDA9_9GAMM|nr:diguanylate cyclase [Allopseudospirillum japonicum]SEI37490.1 PAS domain S-box-containing protein/diguanylate cyclase (GGDEF) domain-containing protein [Allopseudospirillum japonicum]
MKPSFLALSILLLMIFIGLGSISHHSRQQEWQREFASRHQAITKGAQSVLKMSESNMLELARVLASDPKIVQGLRQAYYLQQIVQSQPEIADAKERLGRIREHLIQYLGPRWSSMVQAHGLRQLHLHLAPNATSFVRVHAPERFGDDLIHIRPLLAELMQTGQPQVGFELGRIFGGIRGIVPIFDADQNGQSRLLGSIETGDSLESLINGLAETLNLHAAVLLDNNILLKLVWQHHLQASGKIIYNQQRLESISRGASVSELKSLLSEHTDKKLHSPEGHWQLVWIKKSPHLVSYLPIYSKILNQTSPQVIGHLVFWQDMSQYLSIQQGLQRQFWLLLGIGYLVSLALMGCGLYWLDSHLKKRIHQQAQELSEASRFAERLIEQSPDAIIVTDAQGMIERVNLRFTEITGHLGRHVIGVPITRILGGDIAGQTQKLAQALLQGLRWHSEMTLHHKEGHTYHAAMSFAPINDRHGRLQHFLCSLRDISESHQLREALILAKRQQDQLLANSPAVLYQLPLKDSQATAYISVNVKRLTGHNAEQVLSDIPKWWYEHLHPEEQPQLWQQSHWRHWSNDQHTRLYRLRHADGHYLWISDQIILIRNSQGHPEKLVGALLDVSQEIELRSRLESISRQNTLLLEAAGEGIYGVDAQGMTTFINAAALRLLGYQREQVLGKDAHQLFHANTTEEECPTRIAMRQRTTLHNQITQFRHAQGELLPVELTTSPLIDKDKVQGAVTVFSDISERLRIQSQLEHLALTDGLTELANRRHFMQLGQQELARVRRYQHPACLIMLDIDHFKRINDTFGHACGDIALKQLADAFRYNLRDTDIAARLGGEEFSLLLPDTQLEDAQQLAQRLRLYVEEMQVACCPENQDKQSFSFTISLGVTQLMPEDPRIDTSLSRADKALYTAKNQGRNRVICL